MTICLEEVIPLIFAGLLTGLGTLVTYLGKNVLDNNTKALNNNTLAINVLAEKVHGIETSIAIHEVRITNLEEEHDT